MMKNSTLSCFCLLMGMLLVSCSKHEAAKPEPIIVGGIVHYQRMEKMLSDYAKTEQMYNKGVPYKCIRIDFEPVPTLENLAKKGDGTALTILQKYLIKSPDSSYRIKIADALGRIGDKSSITPLISALDDENWGVVFSSIRSLYNLDSEIAEREVKQRIERETNEAMREHITFELQKCKYEKNHPKSEKGNLSKPEQKSGEGD